MTIETGCTDDTEAGSALCVKLLISIRLATAPTVQSTSSVCPQKLSFSLFSKVSLVVTVSLGGMGVIVATPAHNSKVIP